MPRCLRLVLPIAFLLLPSSCRAASSGFTPAAMPGGPMAADYVRILSRFPLYAERGWHNLPNQPGVGWFGDGRSDENGQRTLANFILTYALLATDPGYDPTVSHCSREHLAGRALAAGRYWLRTHLTQDLRCTDGAPWGHHWQSPWWTSKALTGLHLLWGRLSDRERAMVRQVVTSEAQEVCRRRLETNETNDTKAEENAWFGEVLAWAVCLYPDDPRAPAWRERFATLCMNTISVSADLTDAAPVAGRPVREWVRGANAHDDYTIENHGFFHPCYLACPLHSLAWDVYVYRAFGRTPPEPVRHHARDLWATLYRFALWEGRFAYPAGKDWPRYAYGLYFMLPALVVEQQYAGDRVARLIETQRVATIEREQCHWADGSFFSGRFTHGRMERWPAEWESDCACMLAMACLLHRQAADWPAPAAASELDARAGGVLLSPACRQVSLRGRNRFAAVSWQARGGLQVTFGARGAEDMLEWDGNLAGRLVSSWGHDRAVARCAMQAVPGGFVAAARLLEGTRREIARLADGRPEWELRLSDTNSSTGPLLVPDHPLFTTPHLVTSLAGMPTLDTVEDAAPGWRVLARDVQGRPAILEAAVGKGRLLVSMAAIADDYLAGKPAGLVFENAVAMLAARGRVGYVAVEAVGRQALQKAGVRFQAVRDPGADDLSGYGGILVDRSSDARLAAAWPHLLQYVRAGGLLVKLCLQDSGWQPDWLSVAGTSHAFRHDLLVAALPDDRTLVYLDRWTALSDITITRQEGLGWHVANDLFNGNRRLLHFAGGRQEVVGIPEGQAAERWQSLPGRWLNVDGRVGLALLHGEGEMWLRDSAVRRGGAASICFEDVYFPFSDKPRTCRAGEVAQQTVVALLAGADPAETARYAASQPVSVDECSADRITLGVVAPGGQRYRLSANFALGLVRLQAAP